MNFFTYYLTRCTCISSVWWNWIVPFNLFNLLNVGITFFYLFKVFVYGIIWIHTQNLCLLCYYLYCAWQIKLIFHFICLQHTGNTRTQFHRFSYSKLRTNIFLVYSQNGNEHDNDTFIMFFGACVVVVVYPVCVLLFDRTQIYKFVLFIYLLLPLLHWHRSKYYWFT